MTSRKLITFMLCFAFISCIQPEAPNAEADIELCVVPGDILKKDPEIDNNQITLLPKAGVDITHLALEFTLTPGATINPPSGTPRDFTTPQTYVVTSEDGKWEKAYTISCIITEISIKYNFEYSEKVNDLYYRIAVDDEKQYFWASGNSALNIILGSKGADAYPTIPHELGVNGKCVKLETVSTGSLGSLVGMPLAAGNLFLGEFIPTYAMTRPLSATHFGVPFSQKPISLSGYYKYKAGEKYMEGKVEVNKKDNFDIYAILYETDDEVKYLDGTNALTSPNLISIARLKEEDKVESGNWTHFNTPFVLQPGKEINPEKLATNKYNISLIFSSSIDGATFKGAVGSTLIIDEFEIHCEI